MRMRSLIVWGLGAVALSLCAAGGDQEAAPATAGVRAAQENALKIGTFQRREVLIAYYGSARHENWVDELQRQRDEAVAKGDKARAQQIEAQGAESQEVAHQQLAGNAMLNNVLEAVKPALPQIAERAGVQLIIEAPWYANERVQTIDVTPYIVEVLKTEEKPK